ncbi:hypothetical protein T440DRAFT_478941 [Plenodomus tracheiphilus IPT5]|uniref:Uncharacterized protein n=1 Tax=Plenodomus tracheiphilus IPT5 TaxID=1408161 RepID=A0A6A7B786_9PLEO|nr:hypothetical protein T440DRAFT_478941 [Plenodomus tracheiphilus IPT5]
MSSMDYSDTEAKFRAEARDVHQGEEELQDVFNPQDLEAAARAVFSEDKFAKALLEDCSIHDFTYETILPAEERCPCAMRAVAVEEIGGPIHADLMAKVAVPVELLKTEKSIHIKFGLRYGGGRGVHYCNSDVWPLAVQAEVEYARKTGNMMMVDIGYPMVTRSSGKVIIESIASISDAYVVRNLAYQSLLFHQTEYNKLWGIHAKPSLTTAVRPPSNAGTVRNNRKGDHHKISYPPGHHAVPTTCYGFT